MGKATFKGWLKDSDLASKGSWTFLTGEHLKSARVEQARRKKLAKQVKAEDPGKVPTAKEPGAGTDS
jgi:hypothetical protein